MSKSNKENLDDVSKENEGSTSTLDDDSGSKKETKFTKSKSISEVFNKLELSETDDYNENLEESSVDEIIPIHNEYKDDSVDGLEGSVDDLVDSVDELDDSVEEIIPIHNEVDDLSSNLNNGDGLVINPYSDDELKKKDHLENESDLSEIKQDKEINSTNKTSDLKKDTSDDLTTSDLKEEKSGDDLDDEALDSEGFVKGTDSDKVLDEDEIEKTKPSSQGVVINSQVGGDDSDSGVIDSSFILTILSLIVGIVIFIYGILYYGSGSERVVDNVLSGETAGLAVILMIIGLIIIGFSLLEFFSSRKSSKVFDTFNDIKRIDYDEIKDDTFSRDDFESAFSNIFKNRKYDENDDSDDNSNSTVETSVDQSIDSLIDNLNKGMSIPSSIKNPFKSGEKSENKSSSKKSESTDNSNSSVEPIVPIHVKSSTKEESISQENSVDTFYAGDNAESSVSITTDSKIENNSEFEVFVLDDNVSQSNNQELKGSKHKFKKSTDISSVINDKDSSNEETISEKGSDSDSKEESISEKGSDSDSKEESEE